MYRVVRLESEQFVVILFDHNFAVVVHAAAKQQQVAWHIVVASGAVVKEFHQAAIGGSIAHSRRKFVVNLLDIDHLDAHSLHAAVCSRQAFGFGEILFGRQNHHIHLLQSVQILVCHCADNRGRQKSALCRIDRHIGSECAHTIDKSEPTAGVCGWHTNNVLLVGDVPNLRRSGCARHHIAHGQIVIYRVDIAKKERCIARQFQLAFQIHFEIVEPRKAVAAVECERHIAGAARFGRKGDGRCGDGRSRIFVGGSVFHRWRGQTAHFFAVHTDFEFACRLRFGRHIEHKRRSLRHNVLQRGVERLRFACAELFAIKFAPRLNEVHQIFFVYEIVGKCGDFARWLGFDSRRQSDAFALPSIGRHKVVAVVRIDILCVAEIAIVRISPRGWSLSVENDVVARPENTVAAFLLIDGRFGQVVEIGFREIFVQHSAAVTKNACPLRIDTHILQLLVGEFVEAILRHRNFDKFAAFQHRIGCITRLAFGFWSDWRFGRSSLHNIERHNFFENAIVLHKWEQFQLVCGYAAHRLGVLIYKRLRWNYIGVCLRYRAFVGRKIGINHIFDLYCTAMWQIGHKRRQLATTRVAATIERQRLDDDAVGRECGRRLPLQPHTLSRCAQNVAQNHQLYA